MTPSPTPKSGGKILETSDPCEGWVKHLNEDFQTLAKSQGITIGRKNDGLVIHSLRHFFETQAVDSGIPQFVLDTWMGHVGHETTGRLYYGMSDEKSQDYIKKVNF